MVVDVGAVDGVEHTAAEGAVPERSTDVRSGAYEGFSCMHATPLYTQRHRCFSVGPGLVR